MASTEPAHATNEPNQGESKTVKKVDKFFLTIFLLATTVMVFTIITTVTGQWTKPVHHPSDEQYNLWGDCVCTQMYDEPCAELKRLFKSAQGFSGIAVICEFLALLLFCLVHANALQSKLFKVLAVLFAWGGAVALILTIAIFGSAYNQTYCGTKFKDLGNLHWCYGIRVGEFVIWTAVALMWTVQTGRGDSTSDFTRAILLIAFTVFSLTIATTAARGWMRDEDVNNVKGHNVEVGLWESCYCVEPNFFQCRQEMQYFRNAEAFAILGLLLVYLLVVTLMFAVPRGVTAFFAFLGFGCVTLTWVVFGAWFGQEMCGKPKASLSFTLYWPFGLDAISSLVQLLVFITATVGACGGFH